MTLPRGIRNNNPGNIRGSSIEWQGQVGVDDKGFCIFDSNENGIRALCRLLVIYQTKYSLDTINGIIHRWAPPSDGNDSGAYVRAVCAALGVGPDDPLDVTQPTLLGNLAAAIIQHENGMQPYSVVTIRIGVSLALGLQGPVDVTAPGTVPYSQQPAAEAVPQPGSSPSSSPIEPQPEKTEMGPLAFIPLLTSLAEIFSPMLRTKLAGVLGVKDPQQADVMAGQLMNIVKDAAASVLPPQVPANAPPGTPPVPVVAATLNPVQAVGVVMSQPAVAAKVEAAFDDYIAKLAPVLDRLEKAESAAFNDAENSRDRAAERADATVAAGGVDLGPMLADRLMLILVGLLLLVAGLMGVQMWFAPDHKPSGEIVGLFLTLATTVAQKVATIVDFRFGSSRSSSAKDMIIAEQSRRK